MRRIPDIHLTINTVGDYQTTLMARLAAGNAPDMMGVWGGNYHYDLVKGGH
jgi:ABC-type glycerol-3-phosphate transport system substrate-binding protein